jgi:HK97 family phage major capsid protein
MKTAVEIHRRAMALEATTSSRDTFTLSFSSESPVARVFGDEVLSHAADAVDLSRLNDGAPLLWGHDPNQLLGVVERAEISGGKGRAVVRWGNSPEAQQRRADVEVGVIRNVSVGYQIDQIEKRGDVMVATRWTPLEISLVSIAADASVGIGRSLAQQHSNTMSYEPIENGRPDEFCREAEQFSVVRAIQASASGDWSNAGREREINQELQHRTGKRSQGFLVPDNGWSARTYTVGSATAGGNLVATDLMAGDFIEALRRRLVVAEMGATMLPGLVGNVAIPRRSGTASSYWFGADGADAITESTGSLDQVTMNPKTVGCYSRFSRLMQLQATPEIEQLIRNDFIALIADAIDAAALNGTGSSSQPLGILNTTGIGSVTGGTNGAAPTLDNLLDLKKAVAIGNADVPAAGFVTNAKVEAVLAKLKDSNGRYHLSPYGTEIGKSQIASRQLMVTNNMPSNLSKGSGTNLSAILYGNFSDLLIGMWGTLEVLVDPYTDFAKGSVGVRALQSIDIAVRHAESFAAMKDAIA